ncbi:MAG: hypothetical protein IJY84_02840 [Clostridia bacterium]|nr:hypothetical protein [Clostridia bacterium]
MNSKTKKDALRALVKKATGFEAQETIEEFAELDGEMKLLKRKVTTKVIPPDVSAVKLLIELEDGEKDIFSLSDEELEAERERIINLLKEKYKK